MKFLPTTAAAAALLTALAPLAQASLSLNYQFNGNGNWSIDAGTEGQTLQALVPTGSFVEKAFLYSSNYQAGLSFTVNFDGTVLSSSSDFVSLGVNAGFLQGLRADVTNQVRTKIGSGSGTRFDFSLSESAPSSIDGEVLVVIYSNPSEAERTIALLDGFSASTGDTFTVNLSNPLIDPTTPGFEALLSLGIGFGFQPSGQFSQVDVDGRRLTTSAGGQDDGYSSNGGLITAGGLDDSALNPDPFAAPSSFRTDDELYNLALGNSANSAPFLSAGLTSFKINTLNPSNDDNIFFGGINITARAGVNQPPPPPVDTPVPEPSTYGLMGAVALLGMAIRRRFKK